MDSGTDTDTDRKQSRLQSGVCSLHFSVCIFLFALSVVCCLLSAVCCVCCLLYVLSALSALSAVCCLQSALCRDRQQTETQQAADAADCRLQTAENSREQTADSRHSRHSAQTAVCSLLCLRSAVCCVCNLLSAVCSLLSAVCCLLADAEADAQAQTQMHSQSHLTIRQALCVQRIAPCYAFGVSGTTLPGKEVSHSMPRKSGASISKRTVSARASRPLSCFRARRPRPRAAAGCPSRAASPTQRRTAPATASAPTTSARSSGRCCPTPPR